MVKPNPRDTSLKDSYLWIDQKIAAYAAQHSAQRIYRMGVGDVSYDRARTEY